MSQFSPKKTRYTSILLALLIMSTMIGSSAIFAMYSLQTATENMQNNLHITLTADAKTKAASVKLWLDNLQKDTKRFVSKDMIRLYSAEYLLHNMKLDSGKLPSWAKQSGTGELDLQSTKDALQQELLTFMRQEEDVVDVGIWDTELKPLFMSSEHIKTLTPAQDNLMRKTLTSGKAYFSSIFDSPNGLMANLSYPIFPPDYTDLDLTKPVSVIMLYIPLETVLAKILENKVGTIAPYRLMQWTDDSEELLEFADLNGGTLSFMAGWLAPRNASLPLQERTLSNGEEVYSVGVPLEGYDMMITHEQPSYLAEEFYNNFKLIMTLMVGGTVGITLLIVILGWWFLIYRGERNINQNMLKLYEDVSTKQQILNGINATLVDGVVLTDSLGNIQYANNSFGKMVHHDIESLYGYKMGNIMNPDAAERLQRQLDRVVRTARTHTFEEKITIQDKLLFLQAVCTPYFGAQKKVDGVVSVYRDVTQMLLEREKEQARVEQLIQVLTMAIEHVNPYLFGQSLGLWPTCCKIGS